MLVLIIDRNMLIIYEQSVKFRTAKARNIFTLCANNTCRKQFREKYMKLILILYILFTLRDCPNMFKKKLWNEMITSVIFVTLSLLIAVQYTISPNDTRANPVNILTYVFTPIAKSVFGRVLSE